MAKVTQKQATEVQHWVNHYTRPMFGGKSAADMIKEVLDKLPLYNREKVYRFFALAAGHNMPHQPAAMRRAKGVAKSRESRCRFAQANSAPGFFTTKATIIY